MEKFKEKLSKALIDQNMTMNDLGEKVKISRQTISGFSSNTLIKVDQLEKISSVLKVPLSYWFEEDQIINEQTINYQKLQNDHIDLLKKTIEDKIKIINTQDEMITELKKRLKKYEDSHETKRAV